MIFKFAAVILTTLVLINGIVKMNISARATKGDEYNELDLVERRNKISIIKLFWKKCIINIAISLALVFIFISTFMGNKNNYSELIFIAISIISIIQLIVIEIMYKKLR